MRALFPSLLAAFCCGGTSSLAAVVDPGPYAPAAEQAGSTAIRFDSEDFQGWATGVTELTRGPRVNANPGSLPASFGAAASALGVPNAMAEPGEASTDPDSVVSLGDGGSITLSFANPITDGAGPDFAVFENGFIDTFLELAFVEISSDGITFARFPAFSLTQTDDQISQQGEYSEVDPTRIDGLAGKYRVGYGTPFDLGVLRETVPEVNVDYIRFVRLIDVVGSINPAHGRRDSEGRMINDLWATPFASGGFDLDAVGVLNTIPEPGSAGLLLMMFPALVGKRWRSQ